MYAEPSARLLAKESQDSACDGSLENVPIL